MKEITSGGIYGINFVIIKALMQEHYLDGFDAAMSNIPFATTYSTHF